MVAASSPDTSGQVTQGENFECDHVLFARHLIRHLPCDRHPMGQTAAQYAPEQLTSRPFTGIAGLSPQSCHCLFNLSGFLLYYLLFFVIFTFLLNILK